MADWIDKFFEEFEGRVADEATRSRLLQLLDSARFEGDEDRELLQRIEADELSFEEAKELMRRLLDTQPRIPDQYAPSQTAVARWIRTFVD